MIPSTAFRPLRRRLLPMVALATLAWPLAAGAAEDAQVLYGRAQSVKGADAVPLWNALLHQPPKGVDRATIRLGLIESLDQAAEQSGQSVYYRRALSQATQLKDTGKRFGALVSILRSQLSHGDERTAWSSYVEAQSALDLLPAGSAVHSRSAGELAQALLTGQGDKPAGGKDELEKARLLIDQTSSAPDRAAAAHAVAFAELALEGRKADPSLLAQTGDIEGALRNALALPLATAGRDEYLKRLADSAIDAHDYPRAIDALGGIPDIARVGSALQDLTERLVGEHELVFAGQTADMIETPLDALSAYEALGRAYHALGYTARVEAVDRRIQALLPAISDKTMRADASAIAAAHLARVGDLPAAESVYDAGGDSSHREEALGALAIAFADAGDADKAQHWYGKIGNAATRNAASGKVAQVLAGHDRLRAAKRLLSDRDLNGPNAEEGRFAVAMADIAGGEWSDAEADAKALADPVRRADALSQIAEAIVKDSKTADKSAADRLFAEATALAGKAGDAAAMQRARGLVAASLADARHIDAAVALMKDVADADARLPAEISLTEAYAATDNPNKAYDFAHLLKPERNHDEALSALGIALAGKQMIRLSAEVVKEMADRKLRVKTFRQIAEMQAAGSDFYGILGQGAPARVYPATMRVPADLPAADATPDALKDYDEKTMDMVKSRTDTVLMRTPLATDIGRKLPQVYHPEVLKYDAALVGRMLPATTAFKADRMYYMDSAYNLKFYFAAGNQDFIRRQGTLAPDIIHLESGVVDISRLADVLKQKGLGHDLERVAGEKGRVYILRRPIVIGPKATLVISAADVDELRLSGEEGAYLVNAGRLFIDDTKFTGWSEKKGAAMVQADEPNTFRPFIASWSRSETNIAGSELTALGYTNSKSYGLSISSGPKAFTKFQSRDLKRPSGIIVDNFFRNFLYGFYCYEAEDVVLVGNEYRDNYTYAIDPHDRSRHLTIAYNTTYGTHKKHGIIISREVNYSTILGNLTFENNGSGIMTDRYSIGTLIYANTAFANHGDGLTVYESGCKLIAANRFFENDRSGIKIRNSMDVGVFFNELRDNKQAAVNGYVLDLMHTIGHNTRDVVMDPYSNVTSISAVGNLIQNNGVGINGDSLAALFLKANRFIDQSPRLIRGSWGRVVPQMLSRSNFEEEGVFVTDRCVRGTLAIRSHCNFRDEGYFEGDGQDSLADRLEQNYCKPATPVAAGGGAP